MKLWKLGILLVPLLLAPLAPARGESAGVGSARAEQHGDLEFPKDEHQHLTGWDYWWGGAHLVTEAGNRYTVTIAFNSHYGIGVTGHQVFPRQGPYLGKSILTMDGPPEWGHESYPDRFVRRISTYAPGVSELLKYETLDAGEGFEDIGRWERATLDSPTYRLRIDNAQAKVHPSGERVPLLVDLEAEMHDTPLLAGGSGTWWYGIPETYGYPSRSFQYMQAAQRLTGTIALGQPDGSVLEETVVPEASFLLMTHEYDATPEDLFAGFALAESTQLHPRYAPYYSGGMPWELLFLDLGNGAQLMVAILAFHDTPDGTLAPAVRAAGGDQPTYRVLATVRLPSGESVPLDDVLRVEHLSYRHSVGHVPTFLVQTKGVWTQSWDYRVSYPGGAVELPGGAGSVEVPPFDLGVTPGLAQSEPAADEAGNRQSQRVPFEVRGAWGGCPVDGFGFSELIINWYGREDRDPWWTGGSLPPVPSSCGAGDGGGGGGDGGDLSPPPQHDRPPDLPSEGCNAGFDQPRCEYVSPTNAGVGGYGASRGGWTVTIKRPGRDAPIVLASHGGYEMYACGTVQPGDHVVVEAEEGSSVFAGNPGICF